MAAAFGVRHVEVVAFLVDTTGLTHDLSGVSLDRVHSPFHLEVLLTWGEGFVPLACCSQPSALCCAGALQALALAIVLPLQASLPYRAPVANDFLVEIFSPLQS